MNTLDFALYDIKAENDDSGLFTGYASTFLGAPDSYGDVCMPGCFSETLIKHRRAGTMPLMLWQHDAGEPIGVWSDLVEDGKGLRATGRLLRGVQKAEEAYIRLKAGAVRGLSIGYREVKAEPDGPIRRLHAVDLFEVSVVSMPANRRAQVTEIKHSDHYALLRARILAGEPPSDRELEKGMRDAFNLTNSQAEKFVRFYRKGLAQGEPGIEPNDDNTLALALLRDAIKGFPEFKRI